MNATIRKVRALAGKDFADLIKNPTMFVVCLMPIGFMVLYRFVIGDAATSAGVTMGELAAASEEIATFMLGSSLCMTIGMIVGAMFVPPAVAIMMPIVCVVMLLVAMFVRWRQRESEGSYISMKFSARARGGAARGVRFAGARARLPRPDDRWVLQRARATCGARADIRHAE